MIRQIIERPTFFFTPGWGLLDKVRKCTRGEESA